MPNHPLHQTVASVESLGHGGTRWGGRPTGLRIARGGGSIRGGSIRGGVERGELDAADSLLCRLSDRVAQRCCRPWAPTDPYLLALEHTVPDSRGSVGRGELRRGAPNSRLSLARLGHFHLSIDRFRAPKGYLQDCAWLYRPRVAKHLPPGLSVRPAKLNCDAWVAIATNRWPTAGRAALGHAHELPNALDFVGLDHDLAFASGASLKIADRYRLAADQQQAVVRLAKPIVERGD